MKYNHADASGRVKKTGTGDFNPQRRGSNMRSATSYPSTAKGSGFPAPPADADNGGKTSGFAGTRGGTKGYPSAKSGSTFSRPPNTAKRFTEGVNGSGGSGWLVGGVTPGKAGTNYPGRD